MSPGYHVLVYSSNSYTYSMQFWVDCKNTSRDKLHSASSSFDSRNALILSVPYPSKSCSSSRRIWNHGTFFDARGYELTLPIPDYCYSPKFLCCGLTRDTLGIETMAVNSLV